jgi:hypothetical protein
MKRKEEGIRERERERKEGKKGRWEGEESQCKKGIYLRLQMFMKSFSCACLASMKP